MSDKMSQLISRVLLFGIAGLGILSVIMIFSGSDAGIDLGLRLTYIAFGLAVVMALGFGIWSLVTHGKQSLPAIAGTGAFVLLAIIAYSISGSEVLPGWEVMGVTPTTSKLVGGGIITLYVLLAVTVGAILWSEVSRFFK